MTVSLRRAGPADSELLFSWVNTLDALAGKLLTTEPIPRQQHEEWFAKRLADPETFIWIIESGHRPVGQLRLMKKADAYEVDIYVADAKRRTGVALEALASGLNEFKNERPGSKIVRARVKSENIGSRGLFDRAGFGLVAQKSDHLVFELSIE